MPSRRLCTIPRRTRGRTPREGHDASRRRRNESVRGAARARPPGRVRRDLDCRFAGWSSGLVRPCGDRRLVRQRPGGRDVCPPLLRRRDRHLAAGRPLLDCPGRHPARAAGAQARRGGAACHCGSDPRRRGRQHLRRRASGGGSGGSGTPGAETTETAGPTGDEGVGTEAGGAIGTESDDASSVPIPL